MTSAKFEKELALIYFHLQRYLAPRYLKTKYCREKRIPFIFSKDLRCKAGNDHRIFIIIMQRRCMYGRVISGNMIFICFRLILFHWSFTNSSKNDFAQLTASVFVAILVNHRYRKPIIVRRLKYIQRIYDDFMISNCIERRRRFGSFNILYIQHSLFNSQSWSNACSRVKTEIKCMSCILRVDYHAELT